VTVRLLEIIVFAWGIINCLLIVYKPTANSLRLGIIYLTVIDENTLYLEKMVRAL
jgi:hypothetical protein